MFMNIFIHIYDHMLHVFLPTCPGVPGTFFKKFLRLLDEKHSIGTLKGSIGPGTKKGQARARFLVLESSTGMIFLEKPAILTMVQFQSHTIHGTGIFTYIWLICMVNVGKHTIH